MDEDALAERIAGDLHDGVMQWMVGAKMQAEAIRTNYRSGQPITAESLDALVDSLQNALADSRRLLRGLHGPDVAGGYWHESLRNDLSQSTLAIGATERPITPRADGGAAELQLDLADDTEPLPEATAGIAYRLIREAVWNAMRHASASGIRVTARRQADALVLIIEDDGIGFDPERIPAGRLGVRGLQRRAARAGGTATLRTAPGQGTRYEFRLPLES